MRITKKLTEDITLGFEWEGGAYIEVCVGQAHSSPKEVINVWDYGTDTAEYPFTREGMHSAVNTWIADYGRDELVHDVTENWRYV